jgi:hypothetical protein
MRIDVRRIGPIQFSEESVGARTRYITLTNQSASLLASATGAGLSLSEPLDAPRAGEPL